jgi:hypothetical protein
MAMVHTWFTVEELENLTTAIGVGEKTEYEAVKKRPKRATNDPAKKQKKIQNQIQIKKTMNESEVPTCGSGLDLEVQCNECDAWRKLTIADGNAIQELEAPSFFRCYPCERANLTVAANEIRADVCKFMRMVPAP